MIRHVLQILLERFRANYLGVVPTPRSTNSQNDHQAALRTLTLTRDLSYALDNDKPTLYYQPIVDCITRELVGFEALIRWPHPTMGMIMPNEFIGLAEKTGLIHPLGLWVLQRAISDWATLRQFCSQGPLLYPFLSVNVSADELSDPKLMEGVFQHLFARGIPPQELKIELTETVIIEDRERVGLVLKGLADRGVTIALDDFGTGYSSLSYLHGLPIDTLKIDRSLVADVLKNKKAQAMLYGIIELSREIGLQAVAEGIETIEQAEIIQKTGCNYCQGYLFKKPLSKVDLVEFLIFSNDGN